MFFVIDTSATRSRGSEDRIWQHLWHMRDVVPVSVVLPTIVSSACPLLAEENADAILSSTGIQVPQDSAWIPMRVDVSQFAHDNGDIRLNALERALSDCVDRGDSLHDSRDWPSPAIQCQTARRRSARIPDAHGTRGACRFHQQDIACEVTSSGQREGSLPRRGRGGCENPRQWQRDEASLAACRRSNGASTSQPYNHVCVGRVSPGPAR
jgi:hypothetical protein